MDNVALNPTQLHLLKMFSFAKTEDTLFEIKKALSAYFAQKVEEDMDKLWEEGLWKNEAPGWPVPYEALIPKSLDNLFAAGRCIGTTGYAWEIFRVIPNAAMTGEAAGVAAYLSLRQGVLPHQLPVEILQETLRKECGFPIHFADIGLIPPGKRPLKEC